MPQVYVIHHEGELPADLPRGRPVLVLIGGAGQFLPRSQRSLKDLFLALADLAERHRWTVVDGGTDAGVMRLMGQARFARQGTFPLVGVAPIGRVRRPGRPLTSDTALPEPHHTHLLLVPGQAWGDEVHHLARIATHLAQGAPSVAVLINGGAVSRRDVAAQRAEGRPIWAVCGTGRLADELAQAPPPGIQAVSLEELPARLEQYLG